MIPTEPSPCPKIEKFLDCDGPFFPVAQARIKRAGDGTCQIVDRVRLGACGLGRARGPE